MFVSTAFPLPTITRASGRVRNNFATPGQRGRKRSMRDYVQVASLPYPLSPGAPVLSAPIAASGLSVPAPPPPKKKGSIFKPDVGNRTSGNYMTAASPSAASPGNVGAVTDGNFVSAGSPMSGRNTSGTYSVTSKTGAQVLQGRKTLGRQFWRNPVGPYYGPRLYLSGMGCGSCRKGMGRMGDDTSWISSNQDIPSVINPPAPPAPNWIIGSTNPFIAAPSSAGGIANSIASIVGSTTGLLNRVMGPGGQVLNPQTGQVAQAAPAAGASAIPWQTIGLFGGGALLLIALTKRGRR